MIKRELVLKMNKEFKLTKADISRKLNITKGAVTQYAQGKRASDSSKLRKIKELNSKIRSLAEELSNGRMGKTQITNKFCEICKLAQKKTGVC